MTSQLSARVILTITLSSLTIAGLAATYENDEGGYQFNNGLSPSTQNTSRKYLSCGSHKPRKALQHRIAGGYPAREGEFPSYVQISITNRKSNFYICGGTIISEWMVLSVAHCFSSPHSLRDGSDKVTIYAGGVEYYGKRQYKAKRMCIPEEFPPDGVNRTLFDYSIFILEKPIQFDETMQPACLPWFEVDSSYQAYTVGHGRAPTRSPSGSRHPKVLQVLPVRRTSDCGDDEPGPNRLCFITDQRGDACPGDSGGPVYVTIDGRHTLVGMTQSGVLTCFESPRVAGLYMNVAKLFWDMKALAEGNKCISLSLDPRA